MDPANQTATIYPNESQRLQLYIDGTPGENDSFRSSVTITYKDGNKTTPLGINTYISHKKGILNFSRNVTFEESAWSSPSSVAYIVMVNNGAHSEDVSEVDVEINYYHNTVVIRTFLLQVLFQDTSPLLSTAEIVTVEEDSSTTAPNNVSNGAGQNQGDRCTGQRESSIIITLVVLLVGVTTLGLILFVALVIVLIKYLRRNKKPEVKW